jgi:hypothetical protein
MAHTSPWDDRYSSPEFIYGTLPNAFLAEHRARLYLSLKAKDETRFMPPKWVGKWTVLTAVR